MKKGSTEIIDILIDENEIKRRRQLHLQSLYNDTHGAYYRRATLLVLMIEQNLAFLKMLRADLESGNEWTERTEVNR